MAIQPRLDLTQLNTIAPLFHHPIAPRNVNIVTLWRFERDIACFVPFFAGGVNQKSIGGSFRQVPITNHHSWPGGAQLSLFATSYFPARLIKDRHPVMGARFPDRERICSIFRDSRGNFIKCTNVGLGWTVKVEIPRMRNQLLESAKMLDRKNFAGKMYDSQTGIIVPF